jgi:high-affinity nickel-transport protein
MVATLLAGNCLAWACTGAAFHGSPVLLGAALLAYFLGLRHAFDADHIAAIDNVVRRLTRDRRPAYATGFWFSLGHSTVVVLAAASAAFAAGMMQQTFVRVVAISAPIGGGVSAGFLILIGITNLMALGRIAMADQRDGWDQWTGDNESFAPSGVLASLCNRLFKMVVRPGQMYWIGLLFGLGFDTASEVTLIGLSASQVAHGLGFAGMLLFPALFTAGMTLMDTTDSVLMNCAYRWASANRLSAIRYNLVMTACSVVIALVVAGVQLLDLLRGSFGLSGGPWRIVATISDHFESIGVAITLLLVALWLSFAARRQMAKGRN